MTTAHKSQGKTWDEVYQGSLAEIQQECERRFQLGHTRTQVVDKTGLHYRSAESAREGLLLAEEGELVFARRKDRGSRSYSWQIVKTST